MEFLDIEKVLVSFRTALSMKTGTVDLIQYVYIELDKNNNVAGIFFDLSLAFETSLTV